MDIGYILDPRLVFLTSLIVGSFLSVAVHRLPLGESIIRGRSRCPHCDQGLAIRDLIPILSWTLNKGRCRYCGVGLGRSYPAIEIAAVLVAIWATMVVDSAVLWATCVLGWALLALAVIDWHHHLLPDELTIPLIPAGLITIYLIDSNALPAHVIGTGAGFLSAVAVRQMYFWVRGREGLGLGDAKLLAAAGAWVSWFGLPTVVFLGAILGLMVVSLAALRARSPSLTDRVPFGTYLCAGIWLVWLYGPFAFV